MSVPAVPPLRRTLLELRSELVQERRRRANRHCQFLKFVAGDAASALSRIRNSADIPTCDVDTSSQCVSVDCATIAASSPQEAYWPDCHSPTKSENREQAAAVPVERNATSAVPLDGLENDFQTPRDAQGHDESSDDTDPEMPDLIPAVSKVDPLTTSMDQHLETITSCERREAPGAQGKSGFLASWQSTVRTWRGFRTLMKDIDDSDDENRSNSRCDSEGENLGKRWGACELRDAFQVLPKRGVREEVSPEKQASAIPNTYMGVGGA